jgi:uncharacterized membrane protein YedE/YeeE
VGLGTRIGGGCTSGHGVCGIGRLSKRSFTAVAIFMAIGIACPGPALTALSNLAAEAFVFVGAMIVGDLFAKIPALKEKGA